MSAKNGGTHQGRRTPLSLNTGIPKLQSQNQKGGQAANTNGNTQKEAQQQQLNFKTKKERQQERQQERQREMANKNHENKSTENGHKAGNGGEKAPKQQNGKEKFDKNAAENAAAVAAKDKDTTKAENLVTVIEVNEDKPEKQSGEQKDKKSEESVPMPASEKIETNGGTPSKTTIPTIDLVDEDEHVAMDVTEEANAKPPVGGSVTPKRATRTKTPTPKKLKADKMSMSPTVVLTRADKAAVDAANASVSGAEINATEPESSPEVVSTIQQNTTKTPEKQVVEEKAADDDMMESIQVEPSPIKSPAQEKVQAAVQQAPSSSSAVTNPSATSTPGKYSSRFTYSLADSHVPVVGGRRSIHPINEKYIDRYQSIRESYRRINTELDVTSDTNTSMNVTVGSEIPNNSSFSSFFSRGNRKRDRTPSNLSLNEDVKRELVTSPPKRARFEGFMHLVASPITLLRSRFSRASIQNRVPTRIDAHLDQEEEEIDDNVQNLSGGDENMPPPATDNEPKDEVAAAVTEENAAAHSTEVSVEDITIAEEAKASETPKKDAAPTATTEIGAAGDAKEKTVGDITNQDGAEGTAETTAADSNSNDDDIQIVERQKKGCVIM